MWPGVRGIFLRGQPPQDNNVGSGVVWVTGLFSLWSLSKWSPGSHIGFFGIRTLWVTWFLESNLSLLWNFNFKFNVHVVCGHGPKSFDFQRGHFQNGRLAAILDLSVSGLLTSVRLWISSANFWVAHYMYLCIWKEAYCFSPMSLSKWPPGGHIGLFSFWTLTSAWTSNSNFNSTLPVCMGK